MITEVWQLLRLPALVIRFVWDDLLTLVRHLIRRTRLKATARPEAGRLVYPLAGTVGLLLAALLVVSVDDAHTRRAAAALQMRPVRATGSTGEPNRLRSDTQCIRDDRSTYKICSDRQIAEWDIAEAREIQQLTLRYAESSGDEEEERHSLFDKSLFECCILQLTGLREETLRRLGKNGLSLEELEVWNRLTGDLKRAPYQYKVRDARDFAEVLSQLGLLLLHARQSGSP